MGKDNSEKAGKTAIKNKNPDTFSGIPGFFIKINLTSLTSP